MWCLRAAVGLLVIYGYLGDRDRPYFDSRNFSNVLRWYPVKGGSGEGGEPIRYSVWYRRAEDGEVFRPKMECQNITSLSCDLTAETPSLPIVYYDAQVHATGHRTRKTYHWLPVINTTLGAPVLSMRFSGPHFYLNVTLPTGPGDTPLLELLNRSRRVTEEPVVIYTLNITHPRWAAQVNESQTGLYHLRLKNNNTEYCGYVVYKPSFPPTRQPSENKTFCVVMKSDPWVAVPWFLVAAGLVMVPVILSSVFVYLYTHPRKKPRLPLSLQDILHNPDPSPVCSVPQVCPMEQRKLANNNNHRHNTFPIKQKPKQVSQGGYFPHQCDPCDEDDDDLAPEDRSFSSSAGAEEVNSRGRPPSECRPSTTQSSVSYAQVIFNMAPEDASGPHPVVTTPCEAPVVHRELGDETVKTSNRDVARTFPTVLPVVRTAKGELTLSMLAFRSQEDGDEAEEKEEEKKTLLVDVVAYKAQGTPRLLLSLNSMGGSEDWNDSGCDQSTANTTPTQLSVSSDGFLTEPATLVFPADLRSSYAERDAMASGYKQNWVNVGEDTGGYGFGHQPWTQPPEEEVGEAGEEEQGDGQVFLGGWVLRFQ